MTSDSRFPKSVEKIREVAEVGLDAVHQTLDLVERAIGVASNDEAEAALLRRVMGRVDGAFPGGRDAIVKVTLEIVNARHPVGDVLILAQVGSSVETIKLGLTLEWDDLPDAHRRDLILHKRSVTVVYESQDREEANDDRP